MYSYYLERGIPHTVLDGLDEHEWNFYLASMLVGMEGNQWQTARRTKLTP